MKSFRFIAGIFLDVALGLFALFIAYLFVLYGPIHNASALVIAFILFIAFECVSYSLRERIMCKLFK